MIESVQNPWVKKAVSLHQAKGRKEAGLILVEGPHAVQEALGLQAVKHGFVLDKLFLVEGQTLFILNLSEETLDHCSNRLEWVTSVVMKKMTTTETPPPVVGLFRFEKTPPENRLKTILTKMKEAAAPPCWVILDRLQDPGNVGTIIRSALAFGATGVMTTQNTVDVYSPKVIRSSTGLVFTCSVVDSDLTLKDLVERVLLPAGLQVYAGVGHADTPEYRLADFTKPTALIFGQEGTGVEASVLDQQEALQIQGIRIPMENGVESLNVSISAAVILAEVQTQRTRVVASGPLSLENG